MTQVVSKIVRVNKKFDKHNRLASVEYFYELSTQQKKLLIDILDIWSITAAASDELSIKQFQWKKMIRIVLRTGEYSELVQDDLLEIRKGYIYYKQNNKR